jgi:hypothetical protein
MHSTAQYLYRIPYGEIRYLSHPTHERERSRRKRKRKKKKKLERGKDIEEERERSSGIKLRLNDPFDYSIQKSFCLLHINSIITFVCSFNHSQDI